MPPLGSAAQAGCRAPWWSPLPPTSPGSSAWGCSRWSCCCSRRPPAHPALAAAGLADSGPGGRSAAGGSRQPGVAAAVPVSGQPRRGHRWAAGLAGRGLRPGRLSAVPGHPSRGRPGPGAAVPPFPRVERQQLKWFAADGLILVALPVADTISRFRFDSNRLIELLSTWPLYVAIGIAILRYRLYDIDRLLNRTLVYGLLAIILGLGYSGAALVAGQLSGGLAGQPPDWAVAGATLTVAAVFQPARRRIQAVVDRRFNRRRYAAAATIQGFAARLRQQLDLDALTAELLAVVDQTMEPTQASLWLRPAPQPSHRNRASLTSQSGPERA